MAIPNNPVSLKVMHSFITQIQPLDYLMPIPYYKEWRCDRCTAEMNLETNTQKLSRVVDATTVTIVFYHYKCPHCNYIRFYKSEANPNDY